MTERRRRPNKDERIAACLLMLKRGDDWLIPEPLRSSGTAAEICAAVEWDHARHHALGGDTRPQNITPLRTADHREKSNADNGKIAKCKRVSVDHEEFKRRMLEKEPGKPPSKKSQKPKSKIRSRNTLSKEYRAKAEEWRNGR